MKLQRSEQFATLLIFTLNSHSFANPVSQNDNTSGSDLGNGIIIPKTDNLRNLTQGQISWLRSLTSPKCLDFPAEKTSEGCSSGNMDKLLPKCSINEQDGETNLQSEINGYTCLFSDKIWMNMQTKCLVTVCPASEITNVLTLNYVSSYLMTDTKVHYPKPAIFLSSLCLTDSLPKGYSIPESLPDLQMHLNYKFADAWPEQTATTWIPPSITGDPEKVKAYLEDKRTPLTCAAAQETGTGGQHKDNSGSSGTTKTGTSAPPVSTSAANGTHLNGTAGSGSGTGSAAGLSVSLGIVGAVVGSVVFGALGVFL